MRIRGKLGVAQGRGATTSTRYESGINKELLGQRLKKERKQLNMTQEELAELIGVTPAFVGHIERAERSFSLDTLARLCDALGVTIDYLLCDTLSPKDDDVTAEIRDMLKGKTIRQKTAILDIMRSVSRNI